MSYYYYTFPVPIGFFILICVMCLRLSQRRRGVQNMQQQQRRRGNVRILRRTIIIPRQFESPATPIMTAEDGHPQSGYPHPYDPPPAYESSAVHQSQHPGAYVRVMDNYNRQPDDTSGMSGVVTENVEPAPPPPYHQVQPPMVNDSNAIAASHGLLLDVQSLPCASGAAQPAPQPQSS